MGSLALLQQIFPTQESNRVSCVVGGFLTKTELSGKLYVFKSYIYSLSPSFCASRILAGLNWAPLACEVEVKLLCRTPVLSEDLMEKDLVLHSRTWSSSQDCLTWQLTSPEWVIQVIMRVLEIEVTVFYNPFLYITFYHFCFCYIFFVLSRTKHNTWHFGTRYRFKADHRIILVVLCLCNLVKLYASLAYF